MKKNILTLLRFYALTVFFLLVMSISFAQRRYIARGAEPGELYFANFWYGIYHGGPPYYDTLRLAVKS